MEAKSTSQILQETRALLIADGWCQQFYEIDTRHCLVGALRVVDPRLRRHCELSMPSRPAVSALLQALPGGGVSVCDLMQFNDDPDHDVGEVIALIDRALTEVTK